MSIHGAFEDAVKPYIIKTVPRIIGSNKSITISIAIVLSMMYLFKERVMKPPNSLRHIPYMGYFSIFRTVITGESFWDRTYRVITPFVDSLKNNNGIYLVGSRRKIYFSRFTNSQPNSLGIRKTWVGIVCLQSRRYKTSFPRPG